MTVRLLITDLPLGALPTPEAAERRSSADGLDPAPWAPHEVLVVSTDEEVLADAGRRGLHRLVTTTPEATAAAVVELCAFLDRS